MKNFMYVILNFGWVLCVILAAMISTEIIPPMDPMDLSVCLLCSTGLVFACMAKFCKGEEDGEDHSES